MYSSQISQEHKVANRSLIVADIIRSVITIVEDVNRIVEEAGLVVEVQGLVGGALLRDLKNHFEQNHVIEHLIDLFLRGELTTEGAHIEIGDLVQILDELVLKP